MFLITIWSNQKQKQSPFGRTTPFLEQYFFRQRQRYNDSIMTILLLVRHAETVDNVAQLYAGIRDSE